jgi:hypothetical protein
LLSMKVYESIEFLLKVNKIKSVKKDHLTNFL